MENHLPAGYRLTEIPDEELFKHMDQWGPQIFLDNDTSMNTALMHEALRHAKAAGFQMVLSRHTTTNNSIIIPKLKAGFVITAMEVSDRFGTMVHLNYFFNKTRAKIM